MTTEYRANFIADYESPDYYKVLRVGPGATRQTIDAAYRRMAFQYHPDHNRSKEATRMMQQLNAAYSTLKDERTRRAYDREMLYDNYAYGDSYSSSGSDYSNSRKSTTTTRNTRQTKSGFRAKMEGLAVLVALLSIGYALFLRGPVTSGDTEPTVTGVSTKNVVSSYSAPVIRTLYYTDFDNVQQGDWKLGTAWHTTTKKSYSSKTSLWVGDEKTGAYKANLDTTAEIGRTLDLSSVSNPVLRFEINGQAGQRPEGPVDTRLVVEVAPDGQAYQAVFEAHAVYNQWEEVTLDLAQFKGSDIKVRFHFTSGSNAGLTNNTGYFVDDVRVENNLNG
jgi:curved DNA-binding protein CbpA